MNSLLFCSNAEDDVMKMQTAMTPKKFQSSKQRQLSQKINYQSTITWTSNDYKPILVAMMSYLDNIHYTPETTFSQEHLLALTPADIC